MSRVCKLRSIGQHVLRKHNRSPTEHAESVQIFPGRANSPESTYSEPIWGPSWDLPGQIRSNSPQSWPCSAKHRSQSPHCWPSSGRVRPRSLKLGWIGQPWPALQSGPRLVEVGQHVANLGRKLPGFAEPRGDVDMTCGDFDKDWDDFDRTLPKLAQWTQCVRGERVSTTINDRMRNPHIPPTAPRASDCQRHRVAVTLACARAMSRAQARVRMGSARIAWCTTCNLVHTLGGISLFASGSSLAKSCR